jgi:dTDP-4-dehydrorhamnose 3,5-epimerase
MQFIATQLEGAWIIDPQRLADERGFFARSWCQAQFEQRGLVGQLVQCNISFNHKRGTLRGMHYQTPPHAEAKLVRCTRGAIYDVIVDIRRESPTYQQWVAVELTAENHRMTYAPGGCAHGFQTLADDSEVFYQMSHAYEQQAAAGLRFDDPDVGINWPLEVTMISDKDRSLPLLADRLDGDRS